MNERKYYNFLPCHQTFPISRVKYRPTARISNLVDACPEGAKPAFFICITANKQTSCRLSAPNQL